MKKLVIICLVGGCLFGQTEEAVEWQAGVARGNLAIAAQSATFNFIAAGPASGVPQIKGSPFTAEGVTEFRQILADGTVIQRTTSSKMARDGQGRTRTEQTLMGLGSESPRLVTVFDPLLKQTMILDEKRKSATITKLSDFPFAEHAVYFDSTGSAGGPTFERRVEVLDETVTAPGTTGERVIALSGAVRGAAFYSNAKQEARTEDLGLQVVEGLKASGTRTTTTIPAGAIGNSREISVVRESWFSSELQMVVMNRTSDPQSGETTYRLTNIRRAEPDASLFTAPADYAVQGPQDTMIRSERRIEK